MIPLYNKTTSFSILISQPVTDCSLYCAFLCLFYINFTHIKPIYDIYHEKFTPILTAVNQTCIIIFINRITYGIKPFWEKEIYYASDSRQNK